MIFCTEEQSRGDTITMSSTNQPSLPTNRAFVVQLHAEAKVEQGELKGRVEHIVSMRATHFDSLEELAAFIVQVVTTLQEDDTD
jgi:hypothetical protein